MATATAIDGETTAAVNGVRNLPTDAFVEVLLRLPPSKLRVLSLVCRHWRDVIDERAPPATQTVRALAFILNYANRRKTSAAAYVVDDLAGGRWRELWRSKVVQPVWHHDLYEEMFGTAMVGTCNGLLCLCDNMEPGGAISLANPVTGETLAVPPLPRSCQWSGTRRYHGAYSFFAYDPTTLGCGTRPYHKACSFAYEPTTGRYKVVHVPYYLDRTGSLLGI